MPDPTLADEIAELRRELAMRRRVFPRWVGEGKMKLDDADWKIACMEATLARLEAMAGPPPQGALSL